MRALATASGTICADLTLGIGRHNDHLVLAEKIMYDSGMSYSQYLLTMEFAQSCFDRTLVSVSARAVVQWSRRTKTQPHIPHINLGEVGVDNRYDSLMICSCALQGRWRAGG